MNYSSLFPGQDGELVSFVCRVLEAHGSLAEQNGNRVDLVLPADLSKKLEVEEYISVAPGSNPGDSPLHGENAGRGESPGYSPLYPIHFGAPLLEKISRMAGFPPPLTKVSLGFPYIKKTGFDALINQQFEFYKTTGSVSNSAEFITTYLILTCRYIAQSDEQKEGLVDLAVNMESGAIVPAMVENLLAVEKKYQKHHSHGYTDEEIERIFKIAGIYVEGAVDEDLVDFKRSMNRRFMRDASSLDEYYGALTHEMEESLERAGMSDRLREERMEKIALIPDELRSKQQDLLNKYGIRVKVNLAAVLVAVTTGIKVLFNAVSGKQKKSISLTYNPVTKRMDPLVCSVCGHSMYRIALSKDLKLLCADCQR
ncbi:MAG: hypothetical protein RBR67_07540 [Desulfobacterium sp.]|nr:hypothetical protein [Desulfobacterium sp.]